MSIGFRVCEAPAAVTELDGPAEDDPELVGQLDDPSGADFCDFLKAAAAAFDEPHTHKAYVRAAKVARKHNKTRSLRLVIQLHTSVPPLLVRLESRLLDSALPCQRQLTETETETEGERIASVVCISIAIVTVTCTSTTNTSSHPPLFLHYSHTWNSHHQEPLEPKPDTGVLARSCWPRLRRAVLCATESAQRRDVAVTTKKPAQQNLLDRTAYLRGPAHLVWTLVGHTRHHGLVEPHRCSYS